MVTHQTVGEHDTALTCEDLAALREDLREQQAFRQEQLRQFASTSRAEDRRRQADPARIEVGIKLAASARMVLADVEAALARMDSGEYGACQLCLRPVERHRLLIVPQARYCGRCQQVKEAGR